MTDRLLTQKIYIRVCRDSGFKINSINAAILVGNMLNMHPLLVWGDMGDFSTMERIANGTHPAVDSPTYQ